NQNDRRERIVKISRDITINSKKVISTLQSYCFEDQQQLIDQSNKDLDKINMMIAQIMKELENEEYWKYQRSFTWGLQEYIEAVSFQHYLMTRKLVTLDEIHNKIKKSIGNETIGTIITIEDYLLGLADLTGELMRYATNCVTQKNYEECFLVNEFVRTIYTGLKYIHLSKDLQSKVTMVEGNLQKVEKISCSIRIRRSEFPNSDMMMIQSTD
ncbi:hypothetical protein SAMD00019534_074370, partial [Acytostelium subglobosum LB1]|uniref:hypothetical protein n=1 Tax=Acytostelium subglobosum LB1 TaxID=1410327 RepID=UPI0006451218